jgi:hypothetical protein
MNKFEEKKVTDQIHFFQIVLSSEKNLFKEKELSKVT